MDPELVVVDDGDALVPADTLEDGAVALPHQLSDDGLGVPGGAVEDRENVVRGNLGLVRPTQIGTSCEKMSKY